MAAASSDSSAALASFALGPVRRLAVGFHTAYGCLIMGVSSWSCYFHLWCLSLEVVCMRPGGSLTADVVEGHAFGFYPDMVVRDMDARASRL